MGFEIYGLWLYEGRGHLKKEKSLNFTLILFYFSSYTYVRKEFMNLVDKEINKIWKDGKSTYQNKAKRLTEKYGQEENEAEIHEGVFVGDNKLEELEVQLNGVQNKPEKAVIYGGINGITADH